MSAEESTQPQTRRATAPIEIIVVFLAFFAVIYFSNAPIYAQQIVHPYPHGYFASDAFAYLFLSEHAYTAGNQMYHPFYTTEGYKDVVWQHGIIIYGVTAMLSHLSGMPVYDALYFLATLMLALTGSIAYIIIREFNRPVALVSVGMFAFIFLKTFFFGYLWGQLGAVSGMLFLLLLVWAIMRLDLPGSVVLLAIAFCATILGHIPEFIFGCLFLAFFTIARWVVERRLDYAAVKKFALALAIAVVVCAYYLSTFFFGVFKTQGKQALILMPEVANQSLRVVFFKDWGWPMISLIMLGVAFAGYLFIVKKRKHAALAAGVFFLAMGFSNYYGLGYRAFHVRAFWPFTIAVLVGLAIYTIVSQLPMRIPLLAYAGVGAALFALLTVTYYQPMNSPGIMDAQVWDAYQWIKAGTPESARILILYGDGHSQSGHAIERVKYMVKPEDYATAISSIMQNQSIKREFIVNAYIAYNGNFMYWKGFLQPGYRSAEDNITFFYGETKRDICGFDYYLLDTQSGYAPQLAQLNLYLRERFMGHGMTEVFGNDRVRILKNNEVGGDCLA